MGKCCKCGRETPHEYAYCSGDLLASERVKTYTNVEEHKAFLCTRCTMADLVKYLLVTFSISAVYAAVFAIHTYRSMQMLSAIVENYSKTTDIIVIIFCYALPVACFGMLLHSLHVGRRDKKLPFYALPFWAEKSIVKTMRRQNPSKEYFAPSEYH